MSDTTYHFDANYREESELADGTRVTLRVVQPSDRDLLVRGFDRLSEESRYLRFMGVKPALSESDVASLLDLDGEARFALGAAVEGPDGLEGVGIARFARVPDEPDVAEPAVTVVDAMQGLGLGSLLLRRLAAAARERGVERFRAEILPGNRAMRRLLEDHTDASVVGAGREAIRVVVELPPLRRLMEGSDGSDLLGRLLAHAADGQLTMRLGDVLLKRR